MYIVFIHLEQRNRHINLGVDVVSIMKSCLLYQNNFIAVSAVLWDCDGQEFRNSRHKLSVTSVLPQYTFPVYSLTKPYGKDKKTGWADQCLLKPRIEPGSEELQLGVLTNTQLIFSHSRQIKEERKKQNLFCYWKKL